jgi:hypothetical protein
MTEVKEFNTMLLNNNESLNLLESSNHAAEVKQVRQVKLHTAKIAGLKYQRT